LWFALGRVLLAVSTNGGRNSIYPLRCNLYQSLLRQQLSRQSQTGTTHYSNLTAESSVDDLGTCRGVVLSRAATILRSIET
jgi:hypothetical protein